MTSLTLPSPFLARVFWTALVVFVAGAILSRAAVPTAPTLTVTGPLESHLSLSWTAASGATSYNIYRRTSTTGSETLITTVSGLTTYEDTGLASGTTFYYRVSGVNSSGEGPLSTEASAITKADPPVTFTATAGDSQVVLDWSPSPSATSYKIYRDTLGAASGTTSFIVNSSNTTTVVVNGQSLLTYTDTGLVNGTGCYYQIAPINGSGENPQTKNLISATPTAANNSEAPTGAPTGLKAIAGNAQALVSWLPVSNATSYDIYRGTSSGSETLWHSGVTKLSYTDGSLTNGTTYYYKVRATSSGGSSAPSATEVSATPYVPGLPSGLTATSASGDVTLTWTATGTSYSVYRGTAPGAETLLDSGLIGNTYTDAGLANGTTYYYKVQALNPGGTGPLSSEVSATPTGPAAQSWTQAITFAVPSVPGGPSEPAQSCTASIPDINRPVLFAYFMSTVNANSNQLGPNAQALVTKYNAIIINIEGTTPYNFGSPSNVLYEGTSDDSTTVYVLDYRWPQLSAQRILAALAAAAAAMPNHPEIKNTGIVIHGASVGTDNNALALAQIVGSAPMTGRVLAVIAQSEIDEDRYNPITVLDTVPYLLQATGVGNDAGSQLNVGVGDFPSVNHDVFIRGLSTNQGAALTVFDNVGQGHIKAPDHPFIPIWLDAVLRQRLPATLPTQNPVNLPSWQNARSWAGAYDVTTSTSSPWGSSGNPGVEMVNNIVSSLDTYTDPRPFTWLPGKTLSSAWLAYANSGQFTAFQPTIISASTATATAGTAFAYQIAAANEPTTYNATGPNGTALPAGLSINTTTGVLSGTPSAPGTYSITLTATNSNGTTTSTLTLTVQASSATPNDTPTLPTWALLLLLAALFAAGSVSLRQANAGVASRLNRYS